MAERIKTNCPRDCYDGCGIVIETRSEGRHRVLGDPDHPVSRGKLCSKCAIAYNRSWQDPQKRLMTPLKRVGERGSNDFAPIGWDEALALVAERMNGVIDTHGGASILHTHYSGTLSLIGFLFPNRLFAHIGASEVDPDTICNAAGHVAWHLQFGNSIVGFDPRTAKDARCILVWGANPAHSAPHTYEHWLPESPAKVVVIDPVLTETARAADLHLRPRLGTDAALAFSLLHCLRADGAFDETFIAERTLGYAEIEADIERARPEWGERETGVPAAQIRAAAAIYGEGPSMLWCGQALQRQATGGNIMRATGLLPTLTGNVGKPGSGFCYLNITPVVAGIDLDWLAGAPIATEGGKMVSHMDLAARLSDPEEFKLFFAWNTNPLASAADLTRLRSAMQREDLFTVVCDVFMTDTARFADVVLPAASFMEYDDITFSYFYMHMGAQAKAFEPLGESLPNSEIFRRLAAAMGLKEPALFETDEAMIEQMMAQMNPGFDFAELKRRGHFALGDEPLPLYGDHTFDTPSGLIEIASEQAAEMGLPRTPQPWVDAPPAAGWVRLISPASKWRSNSALANDAHIEKLAGPGEIHLNPGDAAAADIDDGATVSVSNEAGAIRLTARVDADIPAGTAIAYKSRWPSVEPSGDNVNFVHAPRKADMGESTTVHSTEVRLARA